MRNSLTAVCAALGLAACTTAPEADFSGVDEVPLELTSACTPVSVITTTTGIFGTIGIDKALELARNETKKKAREAGANTVAWENGGPGSDDPFVRAQTFIC